VAQLEYLDSSARPYSAPQSVEIRTAKAPAVGHLLQSLGLVVAKHTADDGSIYLTASCTGLLLKIVVATAASDPRETTLHFGVDSLDAALRAAAERKADVLKPPHDSSWGRRAIVADPDGRRIILTERGASPTPIASPPAPAGFTITIPGDVQPATRFIDTSPRKLEDAATPPDLLPAIAAAKRAIITMLIGGIALGGLSAVLAIQAIEKGDNHRLSDVIEGGPALGQHISLFVLLLFIFPQSPRLRYGLLWLAVGIAVSTIVITIVNSADIGDYETTKKLFDATSVYGAASPLLIFLYLAQLSRKAAHPPLVRLVNINLKVYLATIGVAVAMVAATFVAPSLVTMLMVVVLIADLAQFIAFIMLTIRLLQFRPVRANSPKTHSPRSP